MDDHYTLAPVVIQSLDYLLKTNNLNDTEKFNVIKSLLRDVHVQSLVQSDRYLMYTLFLYIFNSNGTSNDLVSLIKTCKYDSDFVYGFIQAMDGEKDPRNLYVCFECIHLICQRLNLGPFIEEIFEVFACYFPIDFTPV